MVSVDSSGTLRSSSSSLVATGPVLVLVLGPDHITYDASLAVAVVAHSSIALHTPHQDFSTDQPSPDPATRATVTQLQGVLTVLYCEHPDSSVLVLTVESICDVTRRG